MEASDGEYIFEKQTQSAVESSQSENVAHVIHVTRVSF